MRGFSDTDGRQSALPTYRWRDVLNGGLVLFVPRIWPRKGVNGCVVGPARERGLYTTQGRGKKGTGCFCAKRETSRCPQNSPVQSSVVLTFGSRREVVPATLRHRGQGCRGMKVQHAQNRKELICPALRDPETETPMNGQAAITPRATGWNREASWADLRMTMAGFFTSSFAGKERHLSGAP